MLRSLIFAVLIKGCVGVDRNRRATLQGQGKSRTLRALRRKQSRRTKYENHVVSKQIVSYAVTHRRAIAVEAALLGIPVIEVNPAYTSQDCSRCGQRNTPNGKSYVCEHCGHKDHRDANAAFNIGVRGSQVGLAENTEHLSRGLLVAPYSGGQEVTYV
jgi:transposase